MPRKIKIILWVAIGLTIAALPTSLLVTYWTQKTIKQVPLKRYLLIAGASAMGILFFQGPIHMLTEAGFIMALFVCPAAMIVGAALALRFKSTLSS
jgi:hypothetical protein